MFCIENVGKDDLRIFQTQYAELIHMHSLVERGFDREPQLKRILVKLFGSLIKLEGSDGRCYEVASYCNDESMILKLARVASKQGKYSLDTALSNLAEKVMQRKEQEWLEQQEEEKEEVEEEEDDDIQEIHSPKETVSQPFGAGFSPVVRKMSNVGLENVDENKAVDNEEDSDGDRYEPMPEGDDDDEFSEEPQQPNVNINPFARAGKKQISTPKPQDMKDGPMKLLSKLAKDKRNAAANVLKEHNQKPSITPPKKRKKPNGDNTKKPQKSAAHMFMKKQTAPTNVSSEITSAVSEEEKKRKTQSKLAMFARKK